MLLLPGTSREYFLGGTGSVQYGYHLKNGSQDVPRLIGAFPLYSQAFFSEPATRLLGKYQGLFAINKKDIFNQKEFSKLSGQETKGFPKVNLVKKLFLFVTFRSLIQVST